MFRSGTTLLARMLNVHRNICLASDPFAPVFKAFRNEVAVEICGGSFDKESPLHDYYFNQEQNNLFKGIQASSFERPLKVHSNKEIIEMVKLHAKPYSPKIIEHIDNLNGRSYADILQTGFEIIDTAYGSTDTQVIGLKEVWTDEFSPLFLRQFSNAKVLHIVRDPRAVVASNYASKTHRYPYLFLCRQWRKLTSLAYHYNDTEDRVMIIKFEDLVENPENTGKDICTFLNIEYDQNMAVPTTFKDGSGTQWVQNSSYKEKKREFNTSVLDKWKDVLKDEQIETIEALCFYEMYLTGYKQKIIKDSTSLQYALDNYVEIKTGMADWIKPYVEYNIDEEISLELSRIKSFMHGIKVDKEQKNILALKENIYDTNWNNKWFKR